MDDIAACKLPCVLYIYSHGDFLIFDVPPFCNTSQGGIDYSEAPTTMPPLFATPLLIFCPSQHYG